MGYTSYSDMRALIQLVNYFVFMSVRYRSNFAYQLIYLLSYFVFFSYFAFLVILRFI